jgi:hypothetical protein
MTPRISSGQLCTVEPVKNPLKKGDIVLAKVRGTPYLHLVTAVRIDQVQISNNHGHVNGWTGFQHVYGILTKVQ